MDSRRDQLLEKYWAGESSIEEEKELRELVLNSEGEEGMDELKSLFSHFDSELEVQLDDSFDHEILSLIQEENKEEAKVVRFEDYFKRYASVAAAILVLMVSSYLFVQQQKTYEQEDTFESPEAALKELKKQMLMVSNYMNIGSESIDELGSMNKAANSMEGLSKMGEAAYGMQPISKMNILEKEF